MNSQTMNTLKAPFPWFGGKSRAVGLMAERFGAVDHLCEPFAGSIATILGWPFRPLPLFTLNDVDACIPNFWRAVQRAGEAVADWADYPILEIDLHARHQWCHARLLDSAGFNARQLKRVEKGLTPFAVRLEDDATFYDAQLAGWWVWGLSAWIGDNWCRTKPQAVSVKRPHLNGWGACGVHAEKVLDDPDKRGAGATWKKRPAIGGRGERANNGNGVHKEQFAGDGSGLDSRRPHLGAENGCHTRSSLRPYFAALTQHLRRARVCCGDFLRVLTPSVTTANGLTGVLLDPPYGVADRDKVYNHDSLKVAARARAWALANGDNPQLRIALCGYAGEHDMPPNWECVAWKAGGGYGNQRKDKTNVNALRERIWFSPHCLQPDMFAGMDVAQCGAGQHV